MPFGAILLSWALLVAQGEPAQAAPSGEAVARAVADGVTLLLEMQEGDENAEWPYEGVYRVGGTIPIGYRVGGSAIVCNALIAAPGYEDDEQRREAVARATAFICESIEHPLMAHDFESRYDVRGWGYTYGLDFLLRLKSRGLVVPEAGAHVDSAIEFFLDGIEATEIPRAGGWNYSRPGGFDAPGPHAPFMTAPTLLALFEAKAMEYEVDDAMLERGVGALERSRTPSGSVMYSGRDGASSREGVPGSVGRMLVTEIALSAAGCSSPERVRGAIDAFLVHWDWLEQRRARHGTHVPPYGIAPYYFFYAHFYAAKAVELLPEHERDEYRRRVRERIVAVRLENGSWNDRVFPRSASYGTAMCVLALLAPELEPPARWERAKPHGAVEGDE